MVAQAVLPRAAETVRAAIALWIAEMIPEDEGVSDQAQLIEIASGAWLPALRRAGPGALSLTPAPHGLGGASQARLRLGEVAGFLDGLLNRAGDPPSDARFREEIARLEAIEELLDGIAIEDGPQARAAGLVIGNLAAAIEDGIARLADICRTMKQRA